MINKLFKSLWLCGCLTLMLTPVQNACALGPSWFKNLGDPVLRQAESLDPNVYQLALKAYHSAQARGQVSQPIVTIIDYSKPSTQRRLWVLDLRNQTVPFYEYVAHGKNSGLINADNFSDISGSKQSSLGTFVTGRTYVGKHGLSLQLIGLERGFNAHARGRAIVLHSAYYASKQYLQSRGYLGRSWGCPAVSPEISPRLIHLIKGGSLVFAYYPNHQWLRRSAYLG